MIRIHSLGAAYWGVEHDPADTSLWTRAWLVEDLPPYRRSTRGWRIRVPNYGLHFGLCVRADDPHRRLLNTPDQIGQWGRKRGDDEAEIPGDDPSSADGGESLRPVDERGRLRSAGDVADGRPGGPGRVPPGVEAGRSFQDAGSRAHQDGNGDGGVGGAP